MNIYKDLQDICASIAKNLKQFTSPNELIEICVSTYAENGVAKYSVKVGQKGKPFVKRKNDLNLIETFMVVKSLTRKETNYNTGLNQSNREAEIFWPGIYGIHPMFLKFCALDVDSPMFADEAKEIRSNIDIKALQKSVKK